MTKRTHFTKNDIEVFLFDKNWENTFKKRIQDWKVAKFDPGHTFVQKLFNEVANYNSYKTPFTDLLNKLDKAGYNFSQCDFLPAMMHMGKVDEKYVETYIQLFTFLESKGFNLENGIKSEMSKMFERTYHPILIEFLESKGIDVYWTNVKSLIQGLRMNATSAFMDMGAVFKSPSGQLSLHPEAHSGDKKINELLLNSLTESQKQNEEELIFIVDYLNKNLLKKEQINELEHLLIPSQFRLQQFLIKERGSFDPFDMFHLGTEKKVKPRDWFNESQLKIIDLVEQKYNLKIVDNEITNNLKQKKSIRP